MPRSIWSGAISFGLVNVPVKLYSAVSRKTVRFHQLHDETGVRIQQKRVDPSTGDEVPYEHVVKGYELAPDRYVVVTPEELEALDPEKTRTIDIEDFVELDQIDPIYYDHPYYLVPGAGAEKAFALLREAMAQSGKVAIARVVIRSKESLVAIRPKERVMAMSTMLFDDEVVHPDSLDEAPENGAKTTKRELEMAQQLIESLTGEFRPQKYRDTYRERVLDLVDRKAAGEEIAVQPAAEEPAQVPDLMAALEASVNAVKERGDADGDGRSRRPAARRRTKAPAGGSRGGSGGKGTSRSKARK
ncbi:MAG: Ku protein [Solirubrobacteraceae bacterium]|jgi:DNA end-binding protein Ku